MNPITAIAFLEGEHPGDITLLVAGQGTYIHIFDLCNSSLLFAHQVFRDQTIHGIKINPQSEGEDGLASHQRRFTCLLWGGRSVTLVTVNVQSFPVLRVEIVRRVQECLLDDWVFDACLSPPSVCSSSLTQPFHQAIVVTDHNRLISLRLSRTSDPSHAFEPIISNLSTGPSAVLYSAHIVWLAEQILVAAGTASGDVLVWDCHLESHEDSPIGAVPGNLIRCFSGHEGSIYGVKIYKLALHPESKRHQFVITSCSDDRTIRIWSMDDELNGQLENEPLDDLDESPRSGFGGLSPHDRGSSKGRCIASVMSHLSRIWDISFPVPSQSSPFLLSFGEDATTRLWRLEKNAIKSIERLQPRALPGHYTLQEEAVLTLHIGKNIWTGKAHLRQDGTCLLSTGGADGRLVTSVLQVTPRRITELTARTGNESIAGALDRMRDTSKDIFGALEGSWTVHRRINSQLQSLPSGDFEGFAKLIPRPPSDPSYNAELLYVEDGQFTTDSGLIMKARRRYVYRYHGMSGSISAWFVKMDETTVDYLFHDLVFSPDSDSERSHNVLRASGSHLCVDDNYEAGYKFDSTGKVLSSWALSYHVKGPSKDYVSDAIYTKARDDAVTVLHDKAVASKDLAKDSFKAYGWLSKKTLLATTGSGRVLLAKLESNSSQSPLPIANALSNVENAVWKSVGQFEELGSHSIICSLPGHLVVMGGIKGTLFIYLSSKNVVFPFVQLPRKIATVSVHKITEPSASSIKEVVIVATCLGLQNAYHISFDPKVVAREHPTSIPHQQTFALPDKFLVTSSGLISNNLLLLGSRHGSFHVYDRARYSSEGVILPIAHKSQVHGNDAVTHVERLPCPDHTTSGIYFLSTGRDGRFAVHCFLEQSRGSYSIETLHGSELPLGPYIEGASFDPITLDLLLWGFRGKEFSVWNYTKQKEVMKVECDGGNRSWAYLPSQDGGDGGSFAWTKISSCHVASQEEASHCVLQSGGHGREIKAMAIRPASDDGVGTLVATGAEDTTIRISKYEEGRNGEFQNLRCLAVLYKHVTGPQVLRWSSDGRYFFSAGGQEEFYAWRVQAVPCMKIGILCIAKCPSVTELADLRITDFDITDDLQTNDKNESQYLISIAYSDSTVRVSFSILINPPHLQADRIIPALALPSSAFNRCPHTPPQWNIHNLLPHCLALPAPRSDLLPPNRQYRRPRRPLASPSFLSPELLPTKPPPPDPILHLPQPHPPIQHQKPPHRPPLLLRPSRPHRRRRQRLRHDPYHHRPLPCAGVPATLLHPAHTSRPRLGHKCHSAARHHQLQLRFRNRSRRSSGFKPE